MAGERAAILSQIRRLSVNDKLALIDELWREATTEVVSGPLSDTERQLLESRVADADANTHEERDWDAVRDELLPKRT